MDCDRTRYSQSDAEQRDGVSAGAYDYVTEKASEVRRGNARRG